MFLKFHFRLYITHEELRKDHGKDDLRDLTRNKDLLKSLKERLEGLEGDKKALEERNDKAEKVIEPIHSTD